MRILITGGEGQLAFALKRVLTKYDLFSPSKAQLDITDVDSLETALEDIKPDIIINTAAMTKVDLCEDEPERAFTINGVSPGILAELSHRFGFILLHISTDYVFDGLKNTPYVEEDCPYPLSVYGNSKLVGENLIKATAEKFYILRTSGIYGPGNKMNFVKFVLDSARKGKKIRVVSDRFASPTYSLELAEQIKVFIEKKPPFGLYHAVNHGGPSWFQFAKKVLEISGLDPSIVQPVLQEDFPQRAKRPAYSVLENRNLKSLGIDIFSPWDVALNKFLQEGMN